MSTFFEKLTGSRQPLASPTDEIVPLEEKRQSNKKLSMPKEEIPRAHLKIELEDNHPTTDELQEEEGELTVDIYDRGDSVIIQSTVAGVRPEDLDVSLTNDTVTIRGRREKTEEVDEPNYYYKELFWGTFSRSVILPEEIEEDMAEASLKHGLLTIRMPKRRKGVVQKLKVKTV